MIPEEDRNMLSSLRTKYFFPSFFSFWFLVYHPSHFLSAFSCPLSFSFLNWVPHFLFSLEFWFVLTSFRTAWWGLKWVNKNQAEVVKISDVSSALSSALSSDWHVLSIRFLVFQGLLKQDKQMGDNDKLHRPHIRKTEHKKSEVEMV